MEMVAHQAECQYADIITSNTDCNIIHPSDEILPSFENVIFLQPVAADMIITFCHTPDTVYA